MAKNDFLLVLVLAASVAGCKAPLASMGSVETDRAVRVLEDSLQGAHLGVMVYDPAEKKVIAGYNHHKYFVPASNTKLMSLYAGLKYLPDTLIGLKYLDAGDTVYAYPTGDPTLLMDEFDKHPVAEWLGSVHKPVVLDATQWRAERYGRGWTWSDYQATYQPERSALPVYGNLMPVEYRSRLMVESGVPERTLFTQDLTMGPRGEEGLKLRPDGFIELPATNGVFSLKRDYASNAFEVAYLVKDTLVQKEIPFVTRGIQTALSILRRLPLPDSDSLALFEGRVPDDRAGNLTWKSIATQPKDSMLKPMMHRSDNFYAEQTLLMASQALLGYMSDRDMIETLLKTDLKDMPDKPFWADGSGLSRYNLFSPADFVWLLEKMKNEFGMARLQEILPTGNDGTLTNYYKPLSGKLFGKTGTLTGQVALSGMFYARSGKLLFFSVLVNNHNMAATQVRRQVESYLMGVWEKN